MDKQTIYATIEKLVILIIGGGGGWLGQYLATRKRGAAETKKIDAETEGVETDNALKGRESEFKEVQFYSNNNQALTDKLLRVLENVETLQNNLNEANKQKGILEVQIRALELEKGQLNNGMALLREQNTAQEVEIMRLKGVTQ